MNVVIKICDIIGIFWAVVVAYQVVFAIIGVFKKKKFKPTDKRYKYEICIAARNEGKVIKNLLESILNQDYPLDKLAVMVCPNNCTDDTADICRKFAIEHPELKIHIFERNCPEEKTKGFALKYLFEQIKEKLPDEKYDGYFIFDADNVLNRDYVMRMNEAFAEGDKIIVSFRNSKNMHQNWISFSYAVYWYKTCWAENRAKAVLNQSCRIQGTGYLFASELVADGWNHVSLTEDRSFCTDAVIKKYKITYVEDAIFHDEQPYTLKVALRQRLRWAKGHIISANEYCPKLIKNMFNPHNNFFMNYDFFCMNFQFNIESICRRIVKFVMQVIIAILASNFVGWLGAFAISFAISFALNWLGEMALGVLTLIIYRKRIAQIEKPKFWNMAFNVFMFPLFAIIARWSTYIAVFKKVEWKPIPHEVVVDVSKLDALQEAETVEQ